MLQAIDFTDKQIKQLVDIIEEKQNCKCDVNKSIHTVWICDANNELRVAFLSKIQLIVSRVEFQEKRKGTLTEILNALKAICAEYGVHRIVMQSVLTPEMAAFCSKNGFTPDKNSCIEVNGILSGNYILHI